VDFIHKKTLVRQNAPMQWAVNDPSGREIAEITQRRDGTFMVRSLLELDIKPVLFSSEDQCYRWVDRLASLSVG
jgi:hypothetical protein